MPEAVKLTLRTGEAKAEVKQAVFETVQEVFEVDMKTAAVEMSPVRAPKGPHNPQGIPGGTNRRSIDTDVNQTEEGVEASIYTQSGYGGYLETGTRNMAARPYIGPAFDQNLAKIAEGVKEKLGG
jgi:HK97 gp10 family phage protein